MSATRATLVLAGLILVFVVSCLPLLWTPVSVDSYGFNWMVRNLPFWSLVTDARIVGYGSIFVFQPLLAYLHFIDLALVPWIGVPGHHVGALLGTLATAVLLFRMVHETNHRPIFALLAAALFLFSPIAWFNVAISERVHYVWSVFFSLLSLRPAWQERFAQRRFDARSASVSALWYGLGVMCKESVTALPLLIAVLRYLSTRRLRSGVIAVVPHAMVLVALLAWRYAILGGLGGYWFSAFVPDNVLTAAPTLFDSLWGRADLAVPWLLALLLRRPGAAVIAAAAYLASVLPFVLGVPFNLVVNVAARLTLTWTLLLLIFASVGTSSRRTWEWIGLAFGGMLLVLQCTRFSVAEAAANSELPAEAWAPRVWTVPTAIVSDHALWYAWDHQSQPEPKAELHAYFSLASLGIDRAQGRAPEGAPMLPVEPRAQPLDLDGIRYWADDSGHFHLRVSAERLTAATQARVGKLYMALQYQNGKTHWTLEMPVDVRRVDIPLSYSTRFVVLFSPDRLPEWPMLLWRSPFFIDPYPPEQANTAGAG